MTAQVSETRASVVRSPTEIGAQPPKSIRVPTTEAEYPTMLDECKRHGRRQDCGFCIKFAIEKVQEFNDRAASEFLKAIPVEAQKLAVDAISRLERTLLPAVMGS